MKKYSIEKRVVARRIEHDLLQIICFACSCLKLFFHVIKVHFLFPSEVL